MTKEEKTKNKLKEKALLYAKWYAQIKVHIWDKRILENLHKGV